MVGTVRLVAGAGAGRLEVVLVAVYAAGVVMERVEVVRKGFFCEAADDVADAYLVVDAGTAGFRPNCSVDVGALSFD